MARSKSPSGGSSVKGNIIGLILNTGWVARSVLIVLAALSVITWAVILEKWLVFRRIRVQSKAFDAIVRKNRGSADLYMLSREYPHCASAVFHMRTHREHHAFRQKRQAAAAERGVFHPVFVPTKQPEGRSDLQAVQDGVLRIQPGWIGSRRQSNALADSFRFPGIPSTKARISSRTRL